MPHPAAIVSINKYLTISFRYLPGEETRLFLPEKSAARDGKSRVSQLLAEKKMYKKLLIGYLYLSPECQTYSLAISPMLAGQVPRDCKFGIPNNFFLNGYERPVTTKHERFRVLYGT
ncbi:Uncharacterized protein dnm_008800 [Desulfonema magnum]|uniref:Uncharacterized protein n=1 Tax=Desulfonema magnum TaxID=45655 RepID=A0A975BG44_9BACT|nr:Uncharacterized protein dnm_008800 [Desulfonema magnum]